MLYIENDCLGLVPIHIKRDTMHRTFSIKRSSVHHRTFSRVFIKFGSSLFIQEADNSYNFKRNQLDYGYLSNILFLSLIAFLH